jgi:hypothetical protein
MATMSCSSGKSIYIRGWVQIIDGWLFSQSGTLTLSLDDCNSMRYFWFGAAGRVNDAIKAYTGDIYIGTT